MEVITKVGEDQNYIIITVKGEIKSGDPRALIQPLIDAYELAAKLEIRKFLLDMREARNMLGIIENYEIVTRMIVQQAAIDRHKRVALLVSPDDHSYDFGASISRTVGFNVRLYRDRTQALASLLND